MQSTEAARVVVRRTVAMASEINVTAVAGEDSSALIDEALGVFHDVDRTCTRFAPDSDLMRANRGGDAWVPVDRYCFDALVEAYGAYRRTDGRFDPRVFADLVRLGYDVSYTVRPPAADRGTALRPREAPRATWSPRFRGEPSEVCVGPDAVDLGGIGKGLALRWAAGVLRRGGVSRFLLDAGGDVVCNGAPPDGPSWRVSIEDPHGSDDPVAVLALRDEAVATSSVRLRHWQVGGTPVHHLIDPRTGLPGGAGLAAVTVVDADPAVAEVWSKVLFLTGRNGIASSAAFHQVPCLWVSDTGDAGWSAPMRERVLWTR